MLHYPFHHHISKFPGLSILNQRIGRLLLLAISLCSGPLLAQDLIITGVIDGPLTGGVPKAVEVYVVNNIVDLSACGLGSANNGGGTDGQEFTFPAGGYLYVASENSVYSNII